MVSLQSRLLTVSLCVSCEWIYSEARADKIWEKFRHNYFLHLRSWTKKYLTDTSLFSWLNFLVLWWSPYIFSTNSSKYWCKSSIKKIYNSLLLEFRSSIRFYIELFCSHMLWHLNTVIKISIISILINVPSFVQE